MRRGGPSPPPPAGGEAAWGQRRLHLSLVLGPRLHFVNLRRRAGPRRGHSHRLPPEGVPAHSSSLLLPSPPTRGRPLLCHSRHPAHRSWSRVRPPPQHQHQGLPFVHAARSPGPRRAPRQPQPRAGHRRESVCAAVGHAGASGSAGGAAPAGSPRPAPDAAPHPLGAPAGLSSQLLPRWASARVTRRHIRHRAPVGDEQPLGR